MKCYTAIFMRRADPPGHTKEFKNLLKQIEKEIKNERENLIQRESRGRNQL